MKTVITSLRYLLCCVMLAPLSAVQASDWNIDTLMSELAQAKPERARFVEKKTMAMLEQPLVSTGELLYAAPDRLEKRTLKPKPEVLVVVGDVVTIERGNRRHSLQLQEYPELAALLDSIRGTLSGNRQALERSFSLKLDGGSQAWRLLLSPNDGKLASMIRVIRIEGKHGMVRSIELEQRDGDSSLMTIEPLAGK